MATILDQVNLHHSGGRSDKVYRLTLAQDVQTYQVMAFWGKRTAPNTFSQQKYLGMSYGGAKNKLNEIMMEKLAKGYIILPGKSVSRPPSGQTQNTATKPMPVTPDRKAKKATGGTLDPTPQGRRLRL